MDSGYQIIRDLLSWIGEDPDREGIRETPRRVIKSYNELFDGYKYTESDIKNLFIRWFEEIECYDEIVVCKNIQFLSFCEHHILPFSGVVHVGYLPDKKVIGLSKIPRLVGIYSHRLQIQERLTQQIAKTIMNHMEPRGVGVVVEAEHSCVSCRGVKINSMSMITSSMLGAFGDDPSLKAEFLKLIR